MIFLVQCKHLLHILSAIVYCVSILLISIMINRIFFIFDLTQQLFNNSFAFNGTI